jgi:hypothetical protein
VLARHVPHHVGAVDLLLQHELDEAVARREQAEPAAAAGPRRQPRRIARQLRQHRLDAAPRPDADETMPPALGNDDAAVRARQESIGKGELARELAGAPGGEVDAPDRPARRLAHEIDDPVGWSMRGRALADDERAGIGEGERGRAGEPAEVRRAEHLAVERAASEQDAAVVERNGGCAIRRAGERADDRIEARGPVAAGDAQVGAAGEQDCPAIGREIVRLRRLQQQLRLVVERRVRPERAVHRRYRYGLAAEPAEQGLEPHAPAPQ